MGTTMIMLVEFYRAGEGRLCGWIAGAATAPALSRLDDGGRTRSAARLDAVHDRADARHPRRVLGTAGAWRVVCECAGTEANDSRPGDRSRAPRRTGRSRGSREWSLFSVEAGRGDSTQAGTGRDVRPMAGSGRWCATRARVAGASAAGLARAKTIASCKTTWPQPPARARCGLAKLKLTNDSGLANGARSLPFDSFGA